MLGTVDTLIALLIAAVVARWGFFLFLAGIDVVAQRASRPDPADIEALTVVIPAWNEEAVITRTVLSVLDSDLPELRVLVVDDGSTDATGDRVRAIDDPRVELIVQTPNQGKPAALNAGIEAATTRLVATLDADTLVVPDCLRWLVATARSTGADAVAANVRVGNRRGPLTRWQSLEYVAGLNLDRRALNRLGLITTVPGAAALWRREAVRAVGGFSGDTLAEDTDLSVTLLVEGYRSVYQDRADAFTEAPVTLAGLYRQRRRWLGGNLAALRKHPPTRGPWAVRLFAIPNLWFAHVGVYVLPLVVSLWVSVGRDGVEIPILGALGSIAIGLDLFGLLGAYAVDRTDKWDLPHTPLQRSLYPLFAWFVWWSVLFRPPRSWAKVVRRDTARLPESRDRAAEPHPSSPPESYRERG